MATHKKREVLLRAYLSFVFIFLLGLAILGRAFYIQTVQGNHYRSLADSLTIFPKKIEAERGNIYSIDGKLMATTLPMFDLRIDFQPLIDSPALFKRNVDSVSLLLSAMFKDKSAAQYKSELIKERNKRNRYYLLKRNVTYVQLNAIKTWPLFRQGRYKSGLIAVQNDKRLMPFGLLAKRTIGFTSKDGVRVGLEGMYDNELKGTAGQVMVQKIAGGYTIPIESKGQINPQPGRDVYTTLDVALQDVAEDALYRALQHHHAAHGCVVLMEVKTGRIKAIANLTVFNDSFYTESYNYAIGEALEPGSTFKLATVAALMEDGYVNNATPIALGNGVFNIRNLTIRDHDAPEQPVLTLQRCFEVSSNVAFAKLANDNYAAQKQKFYDHLQRFGFTEPIDIEVKGAGKPVIAQPKKWSGVSVAYLAHGYELKITPLHTLMFYNAVANNGKMVKPYLVDRIKEYDKTIDSTITVVLQSKICSDNTLRGLRQMLEGVVQNGTARNLKTDYLKVAGKTGTAVIARDNKGYIGNGKKVYQASFCGYFPANEPQYSMIVVINSPTTNGYYGNVVAGNIFKEVADKVYSISLDMHPAVNKPKAERELPAITKGNVQDLKNIYNQFNAKVDEETADWAVVKKANGRVLLADNIVLDGVMPDVTGMSVKDALYLLERNGLRVQVSGTGQVQAQSIVAGSAVRKGSNVLLELR